MANGTLRYGAAAALLALVFGCEPPPEGDDAEGDDAEGDANVSDAAADATPSPLPTPRAPLDGTEDADDAEEAERQDQAPSPPYIEVGDVSPARWPDVSLRVVLPAELDPSEWRARWTVSGPHGYHADGQDMEGAHAPWDRLVDVERSLHVRARPLLAGPQAASAELIHEDGEVTMVVPTATFEVIPESRVWVELLWHAADSTGPPATPSGSGYAGDDVDLHLSHPHAAIDASGLPASWFDQPFVCYWFNKNPDWEVLGDSSYDPSLLRDSTHAATPEQLALRKPVLERRYCVGVVAFKLVGGSVSARVRVWLDGALHESDPVGLERNEYWEVGCIDTTADGLHWEPLPDGPVVRSPALRGGFPPPSGP